MKKRIALKDGNDEVHQLAAAFDRMFERLEQSFAAERQFTSDVSHELRTPMTVIMSQCEFSLEERRSPEEYRDALRVIQRQGGRMTRLIEDMLAFTRLEQQRPELIRLDYSALTENICGDMALIADKGIALTAQIQPDIHVLGDTALLTRLLTNLISNAYRYGREHGHIQVSLSSNGSAAVLAVADDGVGIRPEEQERVFHRFFQADSARSGGGSGLGLAMVREIAYTLGGSVSLESQPEVGSTFYFYLPVIL